MDGLTTILKTIELPAYFDDARAFEQLDRILYIHDWYEPHVVTVATGCAADDFYALMERLETVGVVRKTWEVHSNRTGRCILMTDHEPVFPLRMKNADGERVLIGADKVTVTQCYQAAQS